VDLLAARPSTRPTKKTDRRSKNFSGESVEIDAMPTKFLHQLVEDCITGHINAGEWARECETEKEERETLECVRSAVRELAGEVGA